MANPTLLVSIFDNSLALTDVNGAGTWTGVSPVRYAEVGSADGLWVEEATTNHCVDPQVNTGADFLALRCTLEVDEVTESAIDGKVFKATRTSTPGSAGWGVEGDVSAAIVAGASEVWTFSVYAKSDDAISVTLGADWKNGADGAGSVTGSSNGTPRLLTSAWQRIEETFTTPAGTQSGQPFLYDKGASSNGTIVYSSNFQFEKKGYATSYTDGSLGTGYAWTGTAHDSTSTRAASSVSVDPTGRINAASGSIAFRYKRLIDTGGEEVILTCGSAGAGEDYLEIGVDANDDLYMEWNSDNAGAERVTIATTIATDTDYFFYFDWDGTTIRASIDNGSLSSDTRAAAEGDLTGGDLTLSAAAGSHVIGPFAVFDRPLTTKEITYLDTHSTWSYGMLPLGSRANIFQLRPKAVG